MILAKQYKKRRTYIAFFISYLLMIFITILIGSISYVVTVKTVTGSVEDYNLAMLEQARTVIDEKVSYFQKLSIEVSLIPTAIQTSYLTSINDGESLYNVVKLKNELNSLINPYEFIRDLFIYFPNSNTVVTQEGKFDARLFYYEFLPFENLSFEEWKGSFKEQEFGGFRPVKKLHQKGNYKEVMTYYRPLNSYKMSNSLGVVGMVIDMGKFDKLLEGINEQSNGAVFILNSSNELILKSGNTKLVDYVYNKDLKINPSKYIKTEIGQVVISNHSSPNTQWKYVSVVPMDTYYKKVSFVKKVVSAITAIQLLFGIALAVVMSKRNYKPIRKTYEKIKELIGYSSEDGNYDGDDFSFIEEVTASTIREHAAIKESMESIQPIIKVDLLEQLLNGIVQDTDKVYKNLKNVGIEFKGDDFTVVKIHLDDYKSFAKNDSLQEIALVKLVVSNVLEEVGSKYFDVYSIDWDIDHIAVIISHVIENGGKWEVLETAKEIQRFISERFNIFISIGISSKHKGINNINTCLKEADEALSYKIIKGRGSIINFSEIMRTSGSYGYTLQTEMHLINSIKTGDIETVNLLLDDIFEKNFKSSQQSLDLVRCLLFDITSTALKVTEELHIDQKEVFGEEFNILTHLVKSKTVSQMYSALKETYKILCDYINSNKKSHNVELKDKILDYLEDSYSDNGLSLASVSENIGLNPTYVSYFFKEQVGENFLDYLRRLRIEKSKKMLKETNLSMQAIAEAIGYANSGVFIRTFKKYEGITPGKFREMN